MVVSATARVVNFCARRRWFVMAFGVILMLVSATYDFRRFAIDTDVDALVSDQVPWHRRLTALAQAFPQTAIATVVQAQTPEGAEQATDLLAQGLSKENQLLPTVVQPDSGDFFERSRFLFQPLGDLKQSLAKLGAARPVLATLAGDPSLRGLSKVLSFAAKGVENGAIKLDQLAWPLSQANTALADVLAGRPAHFSWEELAQGHPAGSDQLRHFIEAQPKLDYRALQPGRAATDAIERQAVELKLKERFGATVALTGQVPMNDDEFMVIQHTLPRDTSIAIVGVLIILWLALRSWKLIAAVFFSLAVGLAVTAALALLMVGAFNLISIAFFVLFVGLGVDFGIQFSVRYRSERHAYDSLPHALDSTAQKVAIPLSLAAAATAIGFFSFLPTSYVGLSQLGLIAGCGMIVAFLCSITLVPATLAVLNPPGEPEPVGFARLAVLDSFLQRHRVAVIAVTVLVVLAAVPALFHIGFDFNPIDLQDPHAPSVKAYRELQGSAAAGGTEAEILAPSLARANDIAKRLAALPQVSRALTLSSLIPDEQDPKLQAIKATSDTLSAALDVPKEQAPSDADDVAALRAAATDLASAVAGASGPGAAAAGQMAALLERLAHASVATRQAAAAAILTPFAYDLGILRKSLDPSQVTEESLPKSLLRDWLLPDGRARVEILPKNDPSKAANLQDFATAVLAAEPSASGPGIGYYESKQTVVDAFVEAALIALVAIAALLFAALRRVSDVLLTLLPLLVAGAVTLEVCALSDFSLNFANVIALPLLLGVGVAFKIYYIVAWRAGKTGLLQSTLTRAVVFSALTNAIAFGSLWSSSNPGMSSMGALMFLALLCTLGAAVFFQPVLMGRPRQSVAVDAHGKLLQPGE